MAEITFIKETSGQAGRSGVTFSLIQGTENKCSHASSDRFSADDAAKLLLLQVVAAVGRVAPVLSALIENSQTRRFKVRVLCEALARRCMCQLIRIASPPSTPSALSIPNQSGSEIFVHLRIGNGEGGKRGAAIDALSTTGTGYGSSASIAWMPPKPTTYMDSRAPVGGVYRRKAIRFSICF